MQAVAMTRLLRKGDHLPTAVFHVRHIAKKKPTYSRKPAYRARKGLCSLVLCSLAGLVDRRFTCVIRERSANRTAALLRHE